MRATAILLTFPWMLHALRPATDAHVSYRRPSPWRLSRGKHFLRSEPTPDLETSLEGAGRSLTDKERKTLVALSSVGLAETAFINLQKFGFISSLSQDALCTGTSVACSDILNGPWSAVFGVPLTIPGMIAYATVLCLAAAPMMLPNLRSSDATAEMGLLAATAATTETGLLAATAAMATFSAYLLTILVVKIGAPCPWCILSASLSASLAGIAWRRSDRTRFKLGIQSAGVTLLASSIIYISCSTEAALAEAQSYLAGQGAFSPPPVTRSSSKRSLEVSKILEARGAKLYGAYWCSHCYEQKVTLGTEAMKHITYVECAKDGENSQASVCKALKIPGYPTWEIDGQFYPGEVTLDEIEEILRSSSR